MKMNCITIILLVLIIISRNNIPCPRPHTSSYEISAFWRYNPTIHNAEWGNLHTFTCMYIYLFIYLPTLNTRYPSIHPPLLLSSSTFPFSSPNSTSHSPLSLPQTIQTIRIIQTSPNRIKQTPNPNTLSQPYTTTQSTFYLQTPPNQTSLPHYSHSHPRPSRQTNKTQTPPLLHLNPQISYTTSSSQPPSSDLMLNLMPIPPKTQIQNHTIVP